MTQLLIEFIDRTQISSISHQKVPVQWRTLKFGKVSDKIMKLAYTSLTYTKNSAFIHE